MCRIYMPIHILIATSSGRMRPSRRPYVYENGLVDRNVYESGEGVGLAASVGAHFQVGLFLEHCLDSVGKRRLFANALPCDFEAALREPVA